MSGVTIEFFQLLSLIIVANGAPVVARLLLGNRFNAPIDNGTMLADRHLLFGSSKTWRGVAAALLATTACGLIFDYPAQTGIQIAGAAISGDLLTSFIKRRLALPPNTEMPLFDQAAESLFPALLMMQSFHLAPIDIAWLIIVFSVLDLIVTRMLQRWQILEN